MNRWLLPALGALLLLASCRPQQPGDTLHPLLDRVQGSFDWVLTREARHQRAPDAWPFVQQLTQARVVQILGTYLEGAPEHLFGRVIDAAFDPQGRIAVLDRANGEVRFFDPAGRFLFKVGRAGEGPGEFDRPERLAFDGQGRLYVLDGGRRIQRFRPANDTLFVLDHTYALFEQLDASVQGFCLIDDTLYVRTTPLAWWEQPIVHVLTLTGEKIRAFGLLDFYPPNLFDTEIYQILQALVGEAKLYCDPYTPGILLMYPYFGVIAYYSTQGVRQWQLRFGDPPLMAHKLTDQGGMPVLRSRGFVIHNVLPLPEGQILIHGAFQVMRPDDPFTAASSEEYVYVLDPRRQSWGWAAISFPFFKIYQIVGSQILGRKRGEQAPHVALFQWEMPTVPAP
ncbi:MAG: 6-bladed beta-propeller [Rhodothermus sp.]|nr:6-bladed beta-propeller [Rhodothermus sp.]